jgi:hypothetical protein
MGTPITVGITRRTTFVIVGSRRIVVLFLARRRHATPPRVERAGGSVYDLSFI